jgi:hypothetical protein
MNLMPDVGLILLKFVPYMTINNLSCMRYAHRILQFFSATGPHGKTDLDLRHFQFNYFFIQLPENSATMRSGTVD